jgi:hypothetical protein
VFRIFDSRHDFVLHSGWKMAIMYESNLDFDKLVIESLVALNLSKDLDGLHRETEDFCHSKIMVNILTKDLTDYIDMLSSTHQHWSVFF